MFERFKPYFPFDNEKWNEYISLFNRLEVPSRTVLLQEETVSKKMFLVEKGCLRAWFNTTAKTSLFSFSLKTA